MIDHDLIDWRVSNTWEKNGVKWGMLVAYIDARTAMEELDNLDAGWSTDMQPVTLGSDQGIRCALTVNGVTRVDVGVPSNTEPLKGAFSDALKRAAVQFGVGRELYEMPKIAVECEVVNGKVRGPKALPTFAKGRWTIDRQYGWVKYDREPNQKPEQGEAAVPSGGAARRSVPAAPAPAHPSPIDPDAAAARERMLAAAEAAGVGMDVLGRMAIEVGIPAGQKGSVEQYDLMAAMLGSPNESTADPTSEAPTPDAAVTEAAGDGVPPVDASAASEPPPRHGEEGYAAWFAAQSREERQKLRAQGLGPSDKPKNDQPAEMELAL